MARPSESRVHTAITVDEDMLIEWKVREAATPCNVIVADVALHRSQVVLFVPS